MVGKPMTPSRLQRRKERAERIRATWAEHYDDLASGQLTLAELLGHSDEKLMKIADLAATLLQTGKYEKAGALLRGLPLLDPYVPYFHFLLGLYYEKLKDAESALAEYEEAGALCESMDPPGDLLATVLLSEAKLLAREGQLRRALAAAKRLTSGELSVPDQALLKEAAAIHKHLEAACADGSVPR